MRRTELTHAEILEALMVMQDQGWTLKEIEILWKEARTKREQEED